MSKSRTEQALQNIIYSITGQGLSLLVSFLLRWIFIKYLIEDYLGLDSVLTNIVAMFSLAELGVGSAINYSLYEPLAKKNKEKITSLMNFYKKIYQIIGGAILIFGLLITPLAPLIVGQSIVSDKSIYLYFSLFVITTGTSYFYSYKRTLLIADQYRYIALVYRYLFFILMSLGQSAVLFMTKSYTFFLIVKLIFTFLENYFVSKRVDKMYPFLNSIVGGQLSNSEKNEIWKNSFAMSLHKIGGTVVNSTDSLVMTHFISLSITGLYSNYILITSAITIFVNQFFTSLVASIGNLVAESRNKKNIEEVFNKVFLIGTWLSLLCSAFLYVLVNPFLSVWIGEAMLLDQTTVFFITLNFYLIQVRRTALTFRDAMGLYWFDRYKPIAEAILNLAMSIILARYIGINGVLISTAVSMLFTSIWIEPYILFKKGFEGGNIALYFYKLLFWSLTGFIGLIVLERFFTNILNVPSNILGMIIRFILTFFVYTLYTTLLFSFDKSFKPVMSLIKSLIKKKLRGNL